MNQLQSITKDLFDIVHAKTNLTPYIDVEPVGDAQDTQLSFEAYNDDGMKVMICYFVNDIDFHLIYQNQKAPYRDVFLTVWKEIDQSTYINSFCLGHLDPDTYGFNEAGTFKIEVIDAYKISRDKTESKRSALDVDEASELTEEIKAIAVGLKLADSDEPKKQISLDDDNEEQYEQLWHLKDNTIKICFPGWDGKCYLWD